jgi:hypothetical protein
MNLTLIGGVVNFGIAGTAIAGLLWAQTQFVLAKDFDEFAWATQLEAIYRLQDLLAEAEEDGDEAKIGRYEAQLRRLLAKFCKQYPDDEECS